MIDCPQCSQHVSEKVDRCPQCGAWLADATSVGTQNFEQTVRCLMNAGEVIQAIKVYREYTGTNLADAKAAVEALHCGQELAGNVSEADDMERQILDLMKCGQKIAAIKLHRERYHSSLRDAKEAVEVLAAQHGIVPAVRKAGCLGLLILLVAGVVGVVQICRQIG